MNHRNAGFLALAVLVCSAAQARSQDLRQVGLDIVSFRLYHGYDRGDGWSIAPGLDLGLAGFARTSTGRWGLSLEAESGVLLQDREAHPGSDDGSLRLVYERKLGEAGDHRFKLGYMQSIFSHNDGIASHSEEVFARLQPLISNQEVGFNLRPFIEASYDFTRYHGAYVAIGFEHEMSLERRLGIRSSFQVNARVALSDQRAGDLQMSRSFGFHHATVGLALPFERPVGSISTLVFGPAVGWDWASHAIRDTRHFYWGAQLQLVR